MTYALGLDDTIEQGGAANVAQGAALDVLVAAQLADRAAARAAKDWARSDAIRDTLAAAGIARGGFRGRRPLEPESVSCPTKRNIFA